MELESHQLLHSFLSPGALFIFIDCILNVKIEWSDRVFIECMNKCFHFKLSSFLFVSPFSVDLSLTLSPTNSRCTNGMVLKRMNVIPAEK